VFEGYNEMLDEKSSWCFASFNYPNGYNEAAASDAYNAINHYAQSFVNAVRATGGNNFTRNLIVNTYAASNGEGNWNAHLKEPFTKLVMPTDSVEGHLMLQVHYYPSFSTLSAGKNSVNSLCGLLKNQSVAKGVPIVVGEWGTADDSEVAYGKHQDIFLQWARYFVERAKVNGIGTFLWMGLSDGDARGVPEFSQPDLLEAIVKGYYGDDGYVNAMTVPRDGRPLVEAFYTLSGMRLLHRPVSSGIYLQRGKKVVVK
jgi:hypothetical protein